MKSLSRSGITSRPFPQTQVRPLTLAIALLFTSPVLLAQPTGGQVVSGQASIGTPANGLLTINQTSQKAILNWQNFSIGVGEATHFQQPTGGVALNRVTGGNPSEILGTLTSTGQVFLVNPSGILFGKNSVLNVGGLTASTLGIADADFLDGNYRFFNDGTAKSITNQGELSAYEGSYIALLAPEVRNEGVISARLGTVAIGAGDRVSLDFDGDGLIGLNVEESALNGRIDNKQAIHADGGQVILSARAAGSLAETVINNEGVIRASSVSERNGRIVLEGAHFISQSGSISATGTASADGGSVRLSADNVVLSGDVDVSGQQGGSIEVDANGNLIQVEGSQLAARGNDAAGGQINLHASTADATGQVFLSGDLNAQGLMGGQVHLLGDRVTLASANINATGVSLGGEILIGGGYQGALTGVAHSRQTAVNATSVLDASATGSGAGGSVIVWSDGDTAFAGQALAKGGVSGGDGGLVEVSGKQAVYFDGMVNAGPASGTGKNGVFLLDPKNITISAAAQSSAGYFELSDPSPAAGDQHGLTTQVFGTNQLLVLSPYDDNAATDAGAMYVYNTVTGAMLSMLTGDTANDLIGSGGITTLYNSDGYDYLVKSPNWHGSAGAVTWIDSAGVGLDGVLSGSNSLVGSSANDGVGTGISTIYNSGIYDYVVFSTNWGGGKGAVTFAHGNTGVSGVVDSSNSLVGSQAGDAVGSGGLSSLSSGNYYIRSASWSGGAGAVTFMNRTTGVTGEVSAQNSLVGSSAGDSIGSGGVQSIYDNGTYNYLVFSPNWDGTKGAVTFGSGTGGVSGIVSSSNSFVGDVAGDKVGSNGVVTLSNNGGYDYLIKSPLWHSSAGAVTWFDGSGSGFGGVVSGSNSLVGSSASDGVGASISTIYNSGIYDYVVFSTNWGGSKGAVTFAHGNTGVSGVVDSSNSLVGSQAGDAVGSGGLSSLSSSNYYIRSANWGGGKGAVTFMNRTTGVAGVVSDQNSLVGSSAGDSIGSGGVQSIYDNGTYNYLVFSPNWDGTKGAVTYGSGSTGVSGIVSSSNSYVGDTTGDYVGYAGITTLYNSGGYDYLIKSPYWHGSSGALTWFDGAGTGFGGVIGAANSLVGSSANDGVGSGLDQLSSGKYLVLSPNWGGGKGAVTFMNPTTGVVGVVSDQNSLVGSLSTDNVGSGDYYDILDIYDSNTGTYNYLVFSSNWDGGKGAVTFGSGATGVSGVVSSSNSYVGETAGDRVGSGYTQSIYKNGVYAYLIQSPQWGSYSGAVTWIKGDGSAFSEPNFNGTVSSANSLVGSSANDQVGSGGYYQLDSGNYLILSPNWSDSAGAVTFMDPTTGVVGVVSDTNSLVGSTSFDNLGSGGIIDIYDSVSGKYNYLVLSPNWNGEMGDQGAVTFGDGDTGISGFVSANNSFIGDEFGDRVGSGGVQQLYNYESGYYNYLIKSPLWHASAGAITVFDGDGSIFNVDFDGTVSSSNSLVGSSANDGVGSGGYYSLDSGNYLLLSPNWGGGKGAVTFLNLSDGVTGEVSDLNSLVGSVTTDNVGSGDYYDILDIYDSDTGNYNYLVFSTNWDGGKGAVTFGNGTTGVSGLVSSSNSFVGDTAGDRVGSAYTQQIYNNGTYAYLIKSPLWHSSAGAVTWMKGDGSAFSAVNFNGTVSGENSLVGSSANDNVGSGNYYQLDSGNYLVRSPNWGGGKGAITFLDPTVGVTGVVSASNSLVGSDVADQVGSGGIDEIYDYQNGMYNYLVFSPDWGGGKGAVTMGGSDTGVSGTISSSNSFVGDAAGDQVGSEGYDNLYDYYSGNYTYLLFSPMWHGEKGAVTWFDGSLAGFGGVVSATNSLVGSQAGDQIGSGGTEIIFGDYSSGFSYLVFSPEWNGERGAVTLGRIDTGVVGEVSSSNSFIGDQAGDRVGDFDTEEALQWIYNGNGYNYLLYTPNWHGNAGAVTWFDGTGAGFGGVIGADNSLVGANAGDDIGGNGLYIYSSSNSEDSPENYLVMSSDWDGGKGAVTWGDGLLGVTGIVGSDNSLVGSQAGDAVGSNGLLSLGDRNYLIRSNSWNGGKGALTFFNMADGLVAGTVSSANSIVGEQAGDLTSVASTNLGSERYLIKLPYWASSSGRLLVLSANGISTSGWGYGDNPADSITINPGDIEAIANTGTEVILAANNDIILAENSDILIDNPNGEGGNMIFRAGRSILLNSNITSDGDLDFYANDTQANGVQNAYRDSGAAEITMAANTVIETPGGVRMHMLDGGEAGSITLSTVRPMEIDFLGNVLLTNGGWLGGSGTIDGNLTVNNATFAPGQSPGTVSITGNLVLGEGSTLQIEYGGTDAGQFDSIAVGGTAVLGGDLELLSYDGFVPPSRLSTSFLTGNVSGRFGVVRGALAGLVPEPGGDVIAEDLQSTLQELVETATTFEQLEATEGEQLIDALLLQAEEGGVVNGSEQIQAAATQLAVRREARLQTFAKAISELRANPASADLAECNGSKGEASGACLATRKARDLDKMIADAPSDTRKRVALLIGNDAYTGDIPALSTPISDVDAIAAKLKEKHGFDVTVLRNASKADIVREMNRLATDTVVSDSVMVMYAGHGYQEEGSKGMGYWIPVDAKASSAAGWVSNQDISKLLFAIPARQVMLVSDSCFSGSLTREQRVKAVKGLKREEVLKQRSVLVLSSGGEEPVSDQGHDGHSIFAWNVLKVLDTAENGLTGFELYRQVHEGVIKEFPQQPQYGASIFAGHKGDGDYYLDRLN